MARHREFDVDHAIDAAINVFWQNGYGGTSIQDLVDATGVSRAGLYAVFGNKEGLFNATLDRYISSGVGQIILDAPIDEPLKELMRRVLYHMVEQGVANVRPRGCMITNTAIEMTTGNGVAKAKVAAYMIAIEANLYARIVRGQARNELRESIAPRAAARFIVNNMHGMRVMAKIFPDCETLSDIAESVLSSLD